MDNTFWHRQRSEPLFPDLDWNKPERRDHAGNICIIGGNLHNLGAPAAAYEVIKQAGPSAVNLVLPDKTKRLVGKIIPDALFLPSTVSGEFSRDGEPELIEQLAWADTVVLPGDIGRNSETTILIADCLRAYNGQCILTRDALDSLSGEASELLRRERTTLVVSFAQLQKLVTHLRADIALTFSMDLVKLVEFLHTLTKEYSASIVTMHNNQIIAASNGRVSTTKLLQHNDEPPHWRIEMASLAACYQTWYPEKPFEALTESAHKFITTHK